MQALFLALLRFSYELLLVGLLWAHWISRGGDDRLGVKALGSGQPRQRHPQSPRDCPVCSATPGTGAGQAQRVVEPWATQKSKRGRPKTVETEGHCCPNPGCVYYGITDARLHALVGDGQHYGADTIQYLRCQACHTKVSVRRNTPMYDLKTPVRRVDEVVTATSEGVDVAAASRIFKHDERTIQRWLARMATHSQRLHNHFFHDLVCQHLQLDELITKLRGLKEHVFVWVALEAQTKIIPVIHIGQRQREDAMRFVHEVWQRLAPGAPPVFTTDGLWLYYYALTAHFGQWVPQAGKRWPVWQVDPRLLYGQVHKVKVGYKLKAMFTVAVCGTRAQLRAALGALRLTGRIMTAFVERVNLTLREHIPPLSRRTWSLARDTQALWQYLEWGRAYYHFCRYHEALRLPSDRPHRYRSRTPAMAAGLARRRWRVRELLLMPLPPA
jgi:IS1 family transposase